MRRLVALLCLASALPNVCLADEAGKITAEFGGEARDWYTFTMKVGNEQDSSARFSNDKTLSRLTIQAHPEAKFSTDDVLSVEADWFGPYSDGAGPASVEVVYMPDGMSKPFYTSSEVPDAPMLTFDTIDLSQSPGHVTGHLTARLCLVEDLYGAADLNNCKMLDGTFDTQLMIE